MKSRGLPAAELLQKAVHAELRRRDLLVETDRYVAELEAEVGRPSVEELARARAAVRRVTRAPGRKAG